MHKNNEKITRRAIINRHAVTLMKKISHQSVRLIRPIRDLHETVSTVTRVASQLPHQRAFFDEGFFGEDAGMIDYSRSKMRPLMKKASHLDVPQYYNL